MQPISQKPNQGMTQINADASVLHPLAVTACALEIAAAPDPVYYTYSWISGSVTNAQGYG